MQARLLICLPLALLLTLALAWLLRLLMQGEAPLAPAAARPGLAIQLQAPLPEPPRRPPQLPPPPRPSPTQAAPPQSSIQPQTQAKPAPQQRPAPSPSALDPALVQGGARAGSGRSLAASDLRLTLGQRGQGRGDLKVLHHVSPRFPQAALQQLKAGKVTLEFSVRTDGSVAEVRVLSADPPGLFEAAAIAALEQWRFEPKRIGGRPVESRAIQEVSFEIR